MHKGVSHYLRKFDGIIFLSTEVDWLADWRWRIRNFIILFNRTKTLDDPICLSSAAACAPAVSYSGGLCYSVVDCCTPRRPIYKSLSLFCPCPRTLSPWQHQQHWTMLMWKRDDSKVFIVFCISIIIISSGYFFAAFKTIWPQFPQFRSLDTTMAMANQYFTYSVMNSDFDFEKAKIQKNCNYCRTSYIRLPISTVPCTWQRSKSLK